jgi:hypothetical protein
MHILVGCSQQMDNVGHSLGVPNMNGFAAEGDLPNVSIPAKHSLKPGRGVRGDDLGRQ